MALIILDRQHLGKPGRWNDAGAQNDFVVEAYLTSQYIFWAEWALRDMGFDVVVLSDGTYTERHTRVNQYVQNVGQSVYVACHINAGGGGDYCSTFYDHRSAAGKHLADQINGQLLIDVPEIEDVKSIAASPNDWTKNAYYTIKGVGKPVAVCFEPFFIDNDEHKILCQPDNLRLIGECLAEGIKQYFGG
jgi:N-acetylmuramoyl-L-alanine amidase